MEEIESLKTIHDQAKLRGGIHTPSKLSVCNLNLEWCRINSVVSLSVHVLTLSAEPHFVGHLEESGTLLFEVLEQLPDCVQPLFVNLNNLLEVCNQVSKAPQYVKVLLPVEHSWPVAAHERLSIQIRQSFIQVKTTLLYICIKDVFYLLVLVPDLLDQLSFLNRR